MIAFVFLEIAVFCLWGWKVWLLFHAICLAVIIAAVWIEDKLTRKKK